MNVDSLKERNYRMVELIRQLNERERRRLDRNTQGIKAKCRFHLEQVSDEQRRIKRELVQVRNTTTNTWGFLPPRKGIKQTKPPDGLDQFQMEQFAKQLYDIKPKKCKNSSPESGSRRGAKNPLSFNEEDEFDGDLSDDDVDEVDSNLLSAPSTRRSGRSPQKSPAKENRSALSIDLKKTKDSIKSRLGKPSSLHNTPVNSPHSKFKSITDRGTRGAKDKILKSPKASRSKSTRETRRTEDKTDNNLTAPDFSFGTWREVESPAGTFRIQSLPPLNKVKEKMEGKVAWANTEKSVKFAQSVKPPAIKISEPNSKQESAGKKPDKVMQSQNSQKQQIIQQSPKTRTAQQATPQKPNIKQNPEQKQSQQQNQNTTNPKSASPDPLKSARTLTPITENLPIERQSTNTSDKHNPNRRQSLSVAKKPKKKAENGEKKEENKENGFDRDKYNPDGSLRTIHTLPNFQESLQEALKARYLRNKYKLWHEREMSVSECWSEQNLPWKKLAT